MWRVSYYGRGFVVVKFSELFEICGLQLVRLSAKQKPEGLGTQLHVMLVWPATSPLPSLKRRRRV